MNRLLQKLIGEKSSRVRPAARHGVRPGVEKLEDLTLPAFIVPPSGGLLQILGSASSDIVHITQDDALNQVRVQHNVGNQVRTDVFSSHRITRILVNLRAGSDELTYDLASDFTRTKRLDIDMGADRDRVELDFGKHKSHTIRAHLNIASVTMGAGDDFVRADFGDVRLPSAGARLRFVTDLGSGNDRAEAYQWGILGGDVQTNFTMLGGTQNDLLYFYNDNGTHAPATLAVTMDGGDGDDWVGLFFDDNIIGRHGLRLHGGRGNDWVGATMNVRSGSTGELNIETTGGEGHDRMWLNINDQSNGNLHLARAVMNGGLGVDVVQSATANVQRVGFP